MELNIDRRVVSEVGREDRVHPCCQRRGHRKRPLSSRQNTRRLALVRPTRRTGLIHSDQHLMQP